MTSPKRYQTVPRRIVLRGETYVRAVLSPPQHDDLEVFPAPDRDLLAELHDEQCAHGSTLMECDRLRAENERLRAQILAISEDRGVLGGSVETDELRAPHPESVPDQKPHGAQDPDWRPGLPIRYVPHGVIRDSLRPEEGTDG